MTNRRWRLWGMLAGLAVVVLGGLTLATRHHHPAAVTTARIGQNKGGMAPSQTAAAPSGTATKPLQAPLMLPVSGKVETPMGWQYSGALNEWYYNPGITLAAKAGQSVHAAWGGTVTSVKTDPHMGLTVTVDDGNGFKTVYGHLGNATVKPNQTIQQGQTVGTVGAASIYSRQPGAHVDFQIYHGKVASNPMSYLHPSS